MTVRPAASFSDRVAAFGLAALATLAMLGSVDYLATSEPAHAAVMAAVGAPRA